MWQSFQFQSAFVPVAFMVFNGLFPNLFGVNKDGPRHMHGLIHERMISLLYIYINMRNMLTCNDDDAL